MSVVIPVAILLGLAALAFSSRGKAGSANSQPFVIGEGPFAPKGVEYVIKQGDLPYLIAQRFTRNHTRWPEFVARTNEFGPPKYQRLSIETIMREVASGDGNTRVEPVTLVEPFTPGQVIVLPAEWFEGN